MLFDLINMSKETISMQLNDPVVKEIEGSINRIRNTISANDIKSAEGCFHNETCRKEIKNLDSILSNRFGIKFYHVPVSNLEYAVLVAAPYQTHILKPDIQETYDWLKEEYKKDADKLEDKDATRNNDMGSDYNSYLNWQVSVDELNKHLKTNSITIDLEKATVRGLPPSFQVELLCDFTLLFNKKMGLSDIEITYIILHEVGHEFSYLEYSYRTTKSILALSEAIRTNMNKKGLDKQTSIILAYKEAYHKEPPAGVNGDMLLLQLSNQHIMETFKLAKNNYDSIDSEQQADQFATRFGGGMELASALNKITIFYTETSFSAHVFKIYKIYNYISLIIYIVTKPLIVVIPAIIIGFLIKTAIFVILKLIFASNPKMTYDEMSTRLQRMKNDTIQQIRGLSNDVNPAIIKKFIESVDTITDMVKLYPKESENRNISDRIAMFLSKTMSSNMDIEQMIKTMEILMANQLHVSAKRLSLT